MRDCAPCHPRYAMLRIKRHLRDCTTLGAKRQLAMWGLKLLRAADPGGLEVRHDVAVLRRWLDLLNAADRVARLRAGRWQTPAVTPAQAAAVATAGDDFGALAFARQLRSCSDEYLLYQRLAHQGEIGRRGEVLRAAVEAECAARPWLCAEVIA